MQLHILILYQYLKTCVFLEKNIYYKMCRTDFNTQAINFDIGTLLFLYLMHKICGK